MSNATNLSGIWSNISIYCLNHDEPVKMEITQNTAQFKTAFYKCSAEQPCANRLNLDDYQGICLKLLELIGEEILETNFTNYTFEYRGARQKIRVRVIYHGEHKIKLGILNRTVLGQ